MSSVPSCFGLPCSSSPPGQQGAAVSVSAWLCWLLYLIVFSFPPSRGTQARLPSSSSTLSIAEVFLHASRARSAWQQLSSTATRCHVTRFVLPLMTVASCSAWIPSCLVMHDYLKCNREEMTFSHFYDKCECLSWRFFCCFKCFWLIGVSIIFSLKNLFMHF